MFSASRRPSLRATYSDLCTPPLGGHVRLSRQCEHESSEICVISSSFSSQKRNVCIKMNHSEADEHATYELWTSFVFNKVTKKNEHDGALFVRSAACRVQAICGFNCVDQLFNVSSSSSSSFNRVEEYWLQPIYNSSSIVDQSRVKEVCEWVNKLWTDVVKSTNHNVTYSPTHIAHSNNYRWLSANSA